MPTGANGLRPGPSARRFLRSIGDEEDEDEDGRQRTIVWRIWMWDFFGGTDQRKVSTELGIMSSVRKSIKNRKFRPEVAVGNTTDGDGEGMGMRKNRIQS